MKKLILSTLFVAILLTGFSLDSGARRIRVIRRRVSRVTIKTFKPGRFYVKVRYIRPGGRRAYRKFILRRGIRKYFTVRRRSTIRIKYGRTKRLRRYKRRRILSRYYTINL